MKGSLKATNIFLSSSPISIYLNVLYKTESEKNLCRKQFVKNRRGKKAKRMQRKHRIEFNYKIKGISNANMNPFVV
jgi:hypothetical protein